MSTRYAYDDRYLPPAPVLPIRVGSPGGAQAILMPALVDSGTDICVVPVTVAAQLALPVLGQVTFRGPGQTPRRSVLHAAEIEAGGTKQFVEVLSLGDEAILGRDVLNLLVVVLNGPVGFLELSRQ